MDRQGNLSYLQFACGGEMRGLCYVDCCSVLS